MRILGNTLYVTTPDSYLALEGETVSIKREDCEPKQIPLHNLDSIVVFSYTGTSPALMGECAKRNIALTFMTPHGRFLARVCGEERGNVLLRKTQYRYSDSIPESTAIAKYFIIGKLFNSRWVLERAIRDYPLRVDTEKLRRASLFLSNAIINVQQAQSLEQIRGFEGEAASQYFSVFDELILQQKQDFFFNERNRRPPLDNVNALLSFVYSLLAHETAAALETVGLDPYVGFLHRDRPGRISLALDLMEEFRSVLADRFVLTLINNRQISKEGFIQKENGAVIMDDETRKAVLTAWQKKKQELISHPFLEEKMEWGLIPYAQALLLSRFLRGDVDAYPPFLWK